MRNPFRRRWAIATAIPGLPVTEVWAFWLRSSAAMAAFRYGGETVPVIVVRRG